MYRISEFKTNQNLKIKLFASCRLVKGISFGLICDLDRRQYFRIEIEVIEKLESILNKSYNEIKSLMSPTDFRYVYSFLSENELCFFTKNIDYFPSISDESAFAGLINNCIIDYNEDSVPLANLVYEKFDLLGVVGLEIRYYNSPSKIKIQEELNKSSLSRLRSINLYLKDSKEYDVIYLKELAAQNPRLNQIFIHGSKEEEILLNQTSTIIYSKKVIQDESCCGVINSNNFNTNLEMFNESINFNNCLNKKMSIDKNGFIKNCPSFIEHYGHIGDVDIIHIVESKFFQTKWTINKDKISVCKDCEYRYVCTDCRAYVSDNDDYGKPIKCSYNPTTGQW